MEKERGRSARKRDTWILYIVSFSTQSSMRELLVSLISWSAHAQ
jgi:hypothetical protein